jgi:hypothetical protein
MRYLLFLVFIGCSEKGDAVDAFEEPTEDGPDAVDGPSGDPDQNDGGDDTASDSGEPVDDPEDDVFSVPGEGHWTYGEGEEIGQTDCPTGTGDSTEEGMTAGFVLANTAEGQFTITADGTELASLCQLEGEGFICSETYLEEEVEIPEAYEDEAGEMVDLEMELGISTAMSGVFLSNGNMQADFAVGFECLDAGGMGSFGCMFVTELPCSLAFTAAAELE